MVFISSVDEYIKEINKIIKKRDTENEVIVFRGECKNYPTSAHPNIFRYNHLRDNKYFEINLFDQMKANNLTLADSYLEIAIDAQHGGFQSRLLDVSYNCLVALYFAVTPYYREKITAYDKDDGIVYIFNMDSIYSAKSNTVIENYNTQVERTQEWYCNSSLFQKNYKLIDHIKLNNRIVAQQGAFILFPGDECGEIIKSQYIKIGINHESKAFIRQELNNLFGINTGTIYPEVENTVAGITWKSKLIKNEKFNFINEIDLVLSCIEREVEYYESYLIANRVEREKTIQGVKEYEERLYSYKLGIEELDNSIEELLRDYDLELRERARAKLNDCLSCYNKTVRDSLSKMHNFIKKKYPEIEVSIEELIIEE